MRNLPFGATLRAAKGSFDGVVASTTSDMALARGTRLGTYEVVALLGAGGMGEVYRAHDANLRRDVALKILPDALGADPSRIARFEREARAVAALSHPNILSIHDFGSQDGVRYAVMELLEGQTLRDLMRGGALALPKAMAVVTQIARGLEAAHGRGIVHRDLKPENVFVLHDGHVKILDFGLAKSAGAADARHQPANTVTADATGAGAVLGTVGYMAPEQVRGETADHRADIFALGCVLYELLAGRRAFTGDSAIDTLHATLHDDPAEIATLAAVPPALSLIVTRCIEKLPSKRFQTAADLRFALETIGDASPPSRAARLPPPRGRRRAVAIAAIAIAAAAASGAWYWRPSTNTAAPAAVVPGSRGIAVLPFENLADAEQAYFAAGVTDEVTLQLAKISALRVMSRNAVARFKEPSAQLVEMTRELDLGAVLAGSVRHAGSQVRVSVQLLAAPSGETMWSEQYERTLSNIFEVQSDIAVRVARALQVSLAPEERARIERLPTSNMAAYELYLKHRPLSMTIPAQNDQALRLLGEAIGLDPKFALAHATRARRLTFRGDITGREDYGAAIDAAQTAVAADPQLSRAHFALGLALARVGRIDDARLAKQRAIELDGNDYTAMQDLAIMEVNAGRLDQAVYWARRSLPLAPNLATAHYSLALPLTFLDDKTAEHYLNVASRRFPPTSQGGHFLESLHAVIQMRRGDAAAGLVRMRALEASHPGNATITALTNELVTYAGAQDAAARLDAAVKTSPAGRGLWAPYSPRTLRAHLFVRAGEPERARPLIDAALAAIRKAEQDGDRSFVPPYEEAALQLMLGKRDVALELFDRAIDAGALEGEFPKVDPLMAGMRHDPRFVVSLARIEKRLAEMRTRVDFSRLEALVPSSQ